MNRFFLSLFAFLLVFQSVNAQQTQRNQTDEQGRKQGYWKKFDQMGYVSYEGNFVDGIPIGEFKYYYPNGKIKAVSMMSENGKLSRTKMYHCNGRLMAEGKFFEQKKDSIWNYYSEYDGILLSTEIYKDRLKSGVWKNFYPDGKTAEIFTYENDQRNGSWMQYYTDGTIKLEGNFVNDKKEGAFKMFHPNGQLQVSGQYKNDLKDGLWTEFDENGEKIKEGQYRLGRLISEFDLY